MTPKTRYEREVARLSRALPELSGKWKCRAQGMIDYERSHRWCGHKTHIAHFLVVTQKDGWQVIRHYYQYATFKRKKLWKVDYLEVMQQWMKDGRYVFMARNRAMGYVNDSWCWNSPLSVKRGYGHCSSLTDPRDIGYDDVYYQRVQKRFRYLPKDNSLRVDEMYRAVNISPIYETIIKADAAAFRRLARHEIIYNTKMTAAVRVAWRHRQELTTDWCDMVEMMNFVGMDLHNAGYVAPDDMKAMHDYVMVLVRQKRERLRRQQEERDRIRLERLRELNIQRDAEKARKREEMKLTYPVKRKKFFGLIIDGKGIEIRVLQSVEEFAEEGAEMCHCVYANEYYNLEKHPMSLIMSARRNGKRLETIEVDLRDYYVVQSRAKHNGVSKYHDYIVQLVNDNMDRIKKINSRRRAV